MLTIRLTRDVAETIGRACRRGGVRETGGMLLAEHLGENDFRVLEATVAAAGHFATFVRTLEDGLRRLNAFFRRTREQYSRFNYLGEWHSHPSFALLPSTTDEQTMNEMLND